MKTMIYIIFSIFLFCAINLNAQCQIRIDTISFCYFNGITEQTQTIDKYQIKNNSNEEYLTWVSLIPTNNKSNIELMHDFFKRKKSDFSLIEMMYENLLDKQPISIGYSFIKNITVGKTFSYFIAKTDTEANRYQGRIVLMKKREVEQYLKTQIDEKYFFKLSSILLIQK